jgi:HEAT repeat protein
MKRFPPVHPALSLGLMFCVCVLTPGARSAGVDVRASAPALLQRIWAFERSLFPLPVTVREQRSREFFASLTDAESRIEAIGMMDSRYVYVIPEGVRSELLRDLLKSPDLKVRIRAARAVGYNGLGGEHVEALLALLKQPDPEAKGAAFYAMGASKSPRFTPIVREYLTDPSPAIRITAARSLHNLQPRAAEIESLLRDPDPMVRGGVVDLLPHSAAAQPLLRDPSALVRERAAVAIGNTRDRGLAAGVAPLLKDPAEPVRAAAAVALGRLNATAYREEIEGLLLEDADVVVRRHAALALVELRSPRSLSPLQTALRDEDEQVRTYAARAIRLIEDPQLNPESLR